MLKKPMSFFTFWQLAKWCLFWVPKKLIKTFGNITFLSQPGWYRVVCNNRQPIQRPKVQPTVATWPPKVGKATSKSKKTWKLSSRLYENTISVEKCCRLYHVQWSTGWCSYLFPSRRLDAKTCKKPMKNNTSLWKYIKNHWKNIIFNAHARVLHLAHQKTIKFLRKYSLLSPLFASGAQTSTNSDHASVEGGQGNIGT